MLVKILILIRLLFPTHFLSLFWLILCRFSVSKPQYMKLMEEKYQKTMILKWFSMEEYGDQNHEDLFVNKESDMKLLTRIVKFILITSSNRRSRESTQKFHRSWIPWCDSGTDEICKMDSMENIYTRSLLQRCISEQWYRADNKLIRNKNVKDKINNYNPYNPNNYKPSLCHTLNIHENRQQPNIKDTKPCTTNRTRWL